MIKAEYHAKMLLVVDPSINATGIALLNQDAQYISSTCLKSPAQLNTTEKIDHLSSEFLNVLSENPITEVIIEHTRFFARQQRQSSASAQKLNLVKGVFYGLAKARLEGPLHLIWIPGFSKDKANLLARAESLPSKITQHERDAFWLGHHWLKSPAPMRQSLLNQNLEL